MAVESGIPGLCSCEKWALAERLGGDRQLFVGEGMMLRQLCASLPLPHPAGWDGDCLSSHCCRSSVTEALQLSLFPSAESASRRKARRVVYNVKDDDSTGFKCLMPFSAGFVTGSFHMKCD